LAFSGEILDSRHSSFIQSRTPREASAGIDRNFTDALGTPRLAQSKEFAQKLSETLPPSVPCG